MIKFKKIHHIAIICSNYAQSKKFYTEILGLEVLQEVYREDRKSYKLNLGLNGSYVIELFSFPNPPKRITQPEATGLRHLALAVEDVSESIEYLKAKNIQVEPIRTDPITQKTFTFLEDPDYLPIEIYEL